MDRKSSLLRVFFLSGTLLILASSIAYMVLADPETMQSMTSSPQTSVAASADDRDSADTHEEWENSSVLFSSDSPNGFGHLNDRKRSTSPSSTAGDVLSPGLDIYTIEEFGNIVSAETQSSVFDPSQEESKKVSSDTDPDIEPSPSMPSSNVGSDSSSMPSDSSPMPQPPDAAIPPENPAHSEPTETPSSSEETLPEPEKPTVAEIAEQIRRNERIAEALEDKFQIQILILQSDADDPDGLAAEYATDPFEVGNCLNTCARMLSIFPESFFQYDVVFALADQFQFTDDSQWVGTLFYLCVSYRNPSVSELRSALLDYVTASFLTETDFSLEEFLPEDFIYGDPQSRYVFSNQNQGQGWFLSMSAQQDPDADISAILRKALESPRVLEQATPDSPFFQKCVYCAERFVSWRSAFSENHAIQYFLVAR